MNKLEVFFDYACPYCLRGHIYLKEVLADKADIEVIWRPCEAHPRPETYGPHSDLCIQGAFFALEHGVNAWVYHDRMYEAVHKDSIDIENIDALSDYVSDLLGKAAFRNALKNKAYEKIQLENNDYAYEHSGVWAVPAYRMNGMKLDAVEGVGVSKEQLTKFLQKAIR